VRDIKQTGEYAYTYSPFHKPVARVEPGETVRIHTVDAFDNKMTRESDRASKVCNFPFLNPQTGPIEIAGADPGDVLAVKIHDIRPARDFAVTCLIANVGGLTSTNFTATLHVPLPEETRLLPIKGEQIVFSDKIKLPYKPFLGTIGVAPKIEAISSLVPSYYGGNMDCVETCPGNTIYFQVQVPLAHFFIGDAHATQGDGEITGVACEIPAVTTLSFEVIKRMTIKWPRLESPTHIMAAGSARPLDDALRIASVELIDYMVQDYGFRRTDAYHLLGQAVEYRIGNMVDPNYTVVAKMKKEYLRT
jgi:acetamidase/formamidase